MAEDYFTQFLLWECYVVSAKNYESLAIARTRGKPHLIITMTCNPNHPLILKVLLCGVSPADRPEIVLRLFRQQLLQLTKLLIDGKVPG